MDVPSSSDLASVLDGKRILNLFFALVMARLRTPSVKCFLDFLDSMLEPEEDDIEDVVESAGLGRPKSNYACTEWKKAPMIRL